MTVAKTKTKRKKIKRRRAPKRYTDEYLNGLKLWQLWELASVIHGDRRDRVSLA